MDKYLIAIAQEEEKQNILLSKKEDILEANKKRTNLEYSYSKREERLKESLEKNKKRKFYLQNKKSLLKQYIKKSLLFGLSMGGCFLLLLVAIIGIGISLHLESFNIDFSHLLNGFFSIGGIMSIVEFRNVSREYRSLTSGYRGNIEEDISKLTEDLESLEHEKEKNRQGIIENLELLEELEMVLKEIESRVLEYRTSRNQLVESIIGNLDQYIKDFQYQEIDVHKLLEKKIH